MLTPIRSGTLTILLLLTGHCWAQQWQLVTPIKDRSELCAITLLDNLNGYAIDRTEHNILVTHDGGLAWERRRHGLPYRLTALWVWDMDHVLVASDNGRFYLTSNGFSSITIIDTGEDDINTLFFLNTLTGFAGTADGGILRTLDGGETWVPQASGTSASIMDLHFLDEQEGFACLGGPDLLHTVDGGSTWTPLSTPGTSVIDISFFTDQVGVGVGYSGSIVRTTNGGDSWTVQPSPITSQLDHVEWSAGGVAIAAGVQGKLLRSTNLGVSWTLVQVGNREHFTTEFTADGLGLTGTVGSMYRSVDHGSTWTLVHSGTPNSILNKVSFANNTIGVTVGHTGLGGPATAFMRTTDGGRHWTGTGVYGGVGGIYGVHMTADGAGATGGGSGSTAHTSDYFATSQAAGSPIPSSISAVHAFSPLNYIAAGGTTQAGLYHTLDGGATWAYTLAAPIYDFFFVDDLVGYGAGAANLVVKTEDGGVTWAEQNSGVGSDLFTVFFLDPMHGWVGGASGGAWTADGGESWTYMSVGYCVSIIFTDADNGYAVKGSGQVLRTTDGGATWENSTTTPIENVAFKDATLVDGVLLGVATGGDVFRVPVECPVVATVPTIVELGGSLYSSEASGYQWYVDGVAIPGADSIVHLPSVLGAYTVVVVDALGCPSAPSAPISVIATSVHSSGAKSELAISPNPAQTFLQLHLPFSGAGMLEIRDVRGVTVLRTSTAQGSITVDVSMLSSGLYMASWTGNGVLRTGRFVKE